MTIELGKTYKTRDGREVRIYAVDGGGFYSVHGAVLDSGGWINREWAEDGTYCGEPGLAIDLIEVKPRIKRRVWVNVYRDGNNYPAQCYPNQRTALLNRYAGCIACVEIDIDVEEGHGL